MHTNIYNTEYYQLRDIKKTKSTIKFFLNHPEVMLDTGEAKQLLAKSVALINSPINRIYNSIRDLDYDDFIFIDFNRYRGNDSLPELLDEVCHGKDLNELVSIPDKYQKFIINVTPYTKDSYNGGKVIDLVVKSLIMKSFSNTDNGRWLNNNILVEFIRNYVTVILKVLEIYRPTPDEVMLARVVIGTYIAEQLIPDHASAAMPPILSRCNFLGDATYMLGIYEKYIVDQKPLNFNKVCAILDKNTKTRNSKVTIYRKLCGSALNNQAMSVAIEYPPIWLYQLLRVFGGEKDNVFTPLLRNSRTKREVSDMIDNIIRSGVFK